MCPKTSDWLNRTVSVKVFQTFDCPIMILAVKVSETVLIPDSETQSQDV